MSEFIIVSNDLPASVIEVSTAGPQGPSGTLEIGSVTTGAAGSAADVSNSGTSTNAVFDFVIPKGDTGDVTPEVTAAKNAAEAAASAAAASELSASESADASQLSAIESAASALSASTSADTATTKAAEAVLSAASAYQSALDALGGSFANFQSSGTANGIAFLNGSKVLTTGSALTFDGAALRAARAIFTAADNAYATAFNATMGNLRITPYESSTYSSTALVAYSAGYAGYGPITVDALNHRWWTSGSERMRLTSTGLGIGTSSPAYKLDVTGTINSAASTATGYNHVFRTSGITTGRAQTSLTNTSGDFWTGIEGSIAGTTLTGSAAYSAFAGTFTANPLYFVTNGIIRTTLDSSGNVGIGTTTPYADSRLHLANGNQGLEISINNAVVDTVRFFAYDRVAALYKDIQFRGNNLTFYSGIAERMRLDTNGNLGVGTTAPGARFVAAGTGDTVIQSLRTTGGGGLSVSDHAGRISFGTTDGTTAYLGARIGILADAAWTTGTSQPSSIVFSNVPAASTALTERMRINSSGNLGLGVTPSAWGDSANGTRAIQLNAGSLWNYRTTSVNLAQNSFVNSAQAFTYVASAAASQYSQSAGSHVWYTAPSGTAGDAISFTQAMTLTSTGNLGIGTSSPQLKISLLSNVTANNTSTPLVMLGSDRVDHYASINSVRGSASTFLGLAFSTSNNAAPAEVMRLDPAGNLGLGVTPSPWFTSWKVIDIARSGGLYADASGTNAVGLTNNTYLNSGASAWVYKTTNAATHYQQTAGQHIWFTAPSGTAGNTISFTQAMTLTSTGLGIGTGSPVSTLDVRTSTGASIVAGRTSNVGAASEPGALNFAAPNASGLARTWAGVRAVVNTATTGAESASIIFSNQIAGAYTDSMRIDSSGNVGIGTSSPVNKLDVATGVDGSVARFTGASGAGLIFETGTFAGTALSAKVTHTSGNRNLGFSTPSGTGVLFFETNGTERLRIDSSGNLGLGAVPSAWSYTGLYALQIKGAAIHGLSTETGVSQNAYYNSGWKYIADGVASQHMQVAGGHRWYTAPSGTAGNAISFTQSMTLNASGNLLVGGTTSGNRLTVTGDASSDVSLFISPNAPTGVKFTKFAVGANLGTEVGSISYNGSVGVLYNTSSDYRLKNITGPINTSGEYIDSLNPVEGTWKADGSTFVGLIAHEVQEVSRTNVATGEKDGIMMQAMDYSSSEIIANLIAEVKSLRARVSSLESN